MRRQFRLLSDDGEVGIDHLIASLAHHLHDGGEELCAVGATVPLIGFGHLLAQGVMDSVAQSGLVGALTGGFTAAAGGVTASLTAGFLAALLGKSRDQS